MGSISQLLEAASPQHVPDSQISAETSTPFKSSGTTVRASEEAMQEYSEKSGPQPNEGQELDEGYQSKNNLDDHSESSESSHTVDEDHGSATHHILNDEYRNMIGDIAQIQELRDIGIESRSLPLPKICVVGDQNVGKSSVIEAISGIKVPRGESTTTRCPMEINLRWAEAEAGWKCKVSLVHKYMYIEEAPGRHGKKAASSGLGPWREQQPQKTVHFCDLDNKEDVPNALKWAQIAILNPKTDPKRYIPVRGQTVSPPEQLQVGFSPNLVRLDIAAPSQENLSFYDLPGVIVNSEDQQLIEVVKCLVGEYIRDETCIILLTFSIIEDPMNSNAFKLVRSIQGADKRTRGVFTKADMLQIEPMGASKPTWVEMLEEKRFPLGLGYGVVMNDSRKKEEDFFSTKQPWATSLLRFKDSFGSANLQSALSKLLNEQIRAYLPQIIQKITARIQDTDEELHELPEAPNNDEVMRVLEKMFHFNNELRTQFEGGSPDHPFQKAYRIRAQKFQQTLLQSRPTLQPLSKKEQDRRNQLQVANAARAGSRAESPNTPRHGIIDLDSDNDEPAKFQIKTPPGTRRTFNEAFSPTPAPDSSSRGKRQKTEGQGNKALPGKKFSLDEIREINRDAQGAGLTTPCATKAIERMNRHSVKHWEELMEQFLGDTEKLLKEMVVVEFNKVLGKYCDTPLYKEGGDIIRGYLATAVREQREYAKRAFKIECLTPFTMNDFELKKGKQSALVKLEESRMQFRKSLHVDYEEMRHGRGLSTGEERVKVLKKIGAVELGPDEFTNEIETMAVVRGYYDWACSRFADNICQAFQAELFLNCRDQLFGELKVKLDLINNPVEACKRLLSLDPKIEERRAYLMAEKTRFEEARARLAIHGSQERESSPGIKTDEDVKTDHLMAGGI